MINKEKRQGMLDKAKLLVEVANDMVNGMPTTTACAKHGISAKKLGKFLIMDLEKDSTPIQYNPISATPFGRNIDDYYTWEDRFIYTLFGEEGECLPDFHEAWEMMLETLSEREAEVLRLRFEEELTLEDTGKEFGVSRERIRQVEAKALRKLRHPSRAIYFKKGIHSPEVKELQAKIKAYYDEKNLLLDRLRKQAEIEANAVEELRKRVKGVDKEVSCILDTSLVDLDLSVRAINCLQRAGYKTVRDIAELTPIQFGKIRNLGCKSYLEIKAKVYDKCGIVLKDTCVE